MRKFNVLNTVGALVLTLCFVSAAGAQGVTEMKKGKGGTEVSGSAGPSGAQDPNSDLAYCDKPLGAVAVVEPQDYVMAALSRYGLQSPTGLIRLMIQQSNCFLIVERGIGMKNLMQERRLAESGQLRSQSNVGGGQMVAADFVLTPSVVFSEKDAGGVGGALGGLFGGSSGGAVIGAVAGGLKFKEAQTTMLLADARSSLQVAAAEGSARKADFGFGALLGGGGGGAMLGGYGNTNEGKVIAASLADNYNGIVQAVRNNPSLQRDVGSLASESGTRTQAGEVFNEGDVVRPKISNIKVYSRPDSSSTVVTTLGMGDAVIYMGQEQDGFVSVESGDGGGWVKRVFITH